MQKAPPNRCHARNPRTMCAVMELFVSDVPECLCACADAPSAENIANSYFNHVPVAEANTFYDLPAGPTQLDVDGTRPLLGSVAVCRDGVWVNVECLL
ncbi:hypothetical protein ANCDUO_21973 [Ancylostoma duodenale]|uniref:Uncharacterized protein n=1 Tax=Ancylostoma duodenale TaxID=51022 RepID=A0A0C2CDP4_9BILA|nr:hypothetical protein ANCDUO_21973 [Ancylostoma duodenale]